MKNLLKGALRRVGLDLVRYAPDTLVAPPLLEMAVERAALLGPSPFFVQVGANDGRRDDPLHALVKAYQLEGLLVEPLPYFFAELQEHYADCPQLRFEQAAITRESGETTIYHLPHVGDTPDWAHGLASMDRGRLEAELAKHQWSSSIESTTVPALRFEELLARHNSPAVDILLVDTEGYDFEILDMAFASGCRPAIVQYEFLHLHPSARIAAKRLLIQHGYGVIDMEIDTLAVKLER